MNIMRTTITIALAALFLSSTGCATKRTITGEKRMSGYTSTAKATKSREAAEKKKSKKRSFKMPFADK